MKERLLNQFRHEGIKATLRQCRLFEGLDEASLDVVAEACALKSLSKGENLFHQGQQSWGFYVVQSGVVALYNTRPDGKEQVIALFRENESFAEATLVSMESYPAHARAEAASQVVLIRKAEFRAVIARN
ncbi:MAG: cyclic nucleotide-binding domain-containing protein, partial [Verrucomicrobiae bacterium]|nr:cyclic nucleotide-binding domain-containing protein [Verrucomicrobiae bacterium]